MTSCFHVHQKYVFCLFISSIFLVQHSSAQEINIIVDTIFDSSISSKKSTLFLSNVHDNILVKEGAVTKYPINVSNSFKYLNWWHLLEVDNKIYTVNNDMDFDPGRYIDMDLSKMSKKYNHLMIMDEHFTYMRGDSIFVGDLNSHGSKFLADSSALFDISSTFVLYKDIRDTTYSLYNFESGNIIDFSKSFGVPRFNNDYFVVKQVKYTDAIHLFDADLNSIILPSEGYTKCFFRGDLLFLSGKNKPLKAFKKDKELELPELFTEVETINPLMVFVKNHSDKVKALDHNGNLISDEEFDYISNFNHRNEYFEGVIDNHIKLFDKEFNLLIEGDYRHFNILYPDRLIASNGLIDMKHEKFPDFTFHGGSISPFTFFGTDLISTNSFDSVYIADYNGKELMKWSNRNRGDLTILRKPQYGFPWRLVQKLDDEEELKINPTRIWIIQDKTTKRTTYYAVNKQGRRLSPSFRSFTRMENPNQFKIKTKTGKEGIIEIKL